MRPLKEWPGSRIVAAWLLWPVLLVVAFAVVVGIALWRVGALPGSRGASHVSVSLAPLELPRALLLAAVVLGPPALLTATWARARRGRHGDPPA
jgi:hypothetical protein